MIAIEKLILLSIFIVILLVSLYFIFGTRGTGDSLSDQMKLRQCCTAYRAYKCNYVNLDCGHEPLVTLAKRLGFVDENGNDELLKNFCNCEAP